MEGAPQRESLRARLKFLSASRGSLVYLRGGAEGCHEPSVYHGLELRPKVEALERLARVVGDP